MGWPGTRPVETPWLAPPPPNAPRDYLVPTRKADPLELREWEADMALLEADDVFAASLGIHRRPHPVEICPNVDPTPEQIAAFKREWVEPRRGEWLILE